ncbi:hypothetical protein MLT13_13345 [Escherichia coli]|nr:hypothetical protein [Escherichia coli]MCN2780580.1 hypothetical protein [Escherichia coli]MCN5054849.1 hypothetical protein [Escherichia coli]MCN6060690.1 hypothetical protein [Escherichia coli]MCP3494161.1 hypothetical protein [Escherichia coli]MDH7947329.1 hypothetical protein [Escherichia coli]
MRNTVRKTGIISRRRRLLFQFAG